MTESTSKSDGFLAEIGQSLRSSGAIARLGEGARHLALARAEHLLHGVTGKMTGAAERLTGDGGNLKSAVTGVMGLAKGKSRLRSMASAALTGVKEKVKSALGGGGDGGTGALKATNIVEDINIPLPVDVVYNQWTQYPEFSKFMKGVENVEMKSETESSWRLKVFVSRRSWTATTMEQIPDRRIVWTSEGAKGWTKGAVTFHPLGDDLTNLTLTMEYYPNGFFEKTGNLWRAQGRRARLDLKHFRRFLAQEGKATGAWRGEIRDGEVVSNPDEKAESSDQAAESNKGMEEPKGKAKSGQGEDDQESYQDEPERAPAGR
jgi:uncharacterized membrane protein